MAIGDASHEASIDGAGDAPASMLDRFGVLKLFETTANGREWFASFDNGHPRRIVDGVDNWDPHDPDDPSLYIKQIDDSDIAFRGYVDIDGMGTAEVSVDSGRFYVVDPAVLDSVPASSAKHNPQLPMWKNVEMTVYFQLEELSQPAERKHFISLKARTNHFGRSNGNGNGRNYDVSFRFDDENGEVWLSKETIHGAYSSGNQPEGVDDLNWWPAKFPIDTWVGMKFVLRNRDGDAHVQLEAYRDLSAAMTGTPGEDGGTWEKLFEYVDDGHWGVVDPEEIDLINGAIASDPTNPELYGPPIDSTSQIWTAAAYACNLRINRVQRGYLRYYSIREIEPLP